MSNLFLRLRSPLALIILAYFVLGALYAALTPPWQAPDEPAHYNYVKYLAENRRFPVLQMGDYPHEYLEEIKARRFPPDMSIAPIRYEFHQPPLYYILATPVYLLFGGELLPLRLLSVLLGSALLYVAYRLVRELFPNEEELALWNRYSTGLALGTAAFVAFVPMHVAMTAAVNNDALAELILASVLWMLVRYVGKSEKQLIGLGVLMGLGLLTKTTAYIAIPLALLAALLSFGRRSLRRCLLPACCSLLIALPWFVRNVLVYGDLDLLGLKSHDAVVVGQPRTSEWLSLYGAGEVAKRFLFTTFRS
ncbi:MAG: glycosyltransferase family 39 protein, partial [Chloroflexota bacterium]|nr:glycosyltransferase family 39 protein [Chloroflexota bacterium]